MSTTEAIDRHTYHPVLVGGKPIRGFTYRYQAGGSKRFYGYVPGRGRVLLDARTQREARAEWDELRGKARRGEALPRRNVKLRDIEPQWWDQKRRKLATGTEKQYRSYLDLVHLPLFGNRRLAEIDADAISRLDHGLAERGLNYVDRSRPVRPLSRSQVNNYMKPLRALLAYAVRHKKGITGNPFNDLTEDDRADDDSERFVYEWSDEEIAKVIAKAEELDRRPEAKREYAPLIRAAIETGQRLGELLGSDWSDLLGGGVWKVERQWTKHGELTAPKTKNGVRRIPLTPEFERYMKAYRLRSRFSQDGDPVFAARGRGGSEKGGGTRLSHRNVQRRAWEPIRKARGLPEKVTFHQLRHAFASRAKARGVTLEDLSMVMGHSSIDVTAKVYVHLYGREQAEERFRQAMSG
jgi:integrase